MRYKYVSGIRFRCSRSSSKRVVQKLPAKQLHRCRRQVSRCGSSHQEELRIDSFRSRRPAMSSRISPSRSNLPVASPITCVPTHTENQVGKHVRSCLMDFRQDGVGGTYSVPTSFQEWLAVLIFAQQVSRCGSSHQAADEGVQDVPHVRRVEAHRFPSLRCSSAARWASGES